MITTIIAVAMGYVLGRLAFGLMAGWTYSAHMQHELRHRHSFNPTLLPWWLSHLR